MILLRDVIDFGEKSVFLNVIFYTITFIFLLTLTTFAECVTQWYNSSRVRIYLATGIAAFLISVLHRFVEFPAQSLTTYIFMK